MNEFTLLPGESVIKRCDEVSLKGMNLPVGKKDILILTNQYLVCIQRSILKMADNVDKAMGKFRKAFGIKSTAQASGKCPGCGAPLSGTEGETVQCPYCGTYYTF